jgi:hypothetical protein
MAETSAVERRIPIEWHVPEGFVSQFANNMVVQRMGNDFFVYFFQIKPPIILGPPEFREAQAKRIESVRAECVASVAIAADKLPEFIKTLQENLEKFQKEKTVQEEDE